MISTTFASDLYALTKNHELSFDSEKLKKASQLFSQKQVKKVYHGSPNKIDAFHEAKEGEKAAMLFGHGLYFTDSQNIAETYRLPRYTEGVQSEVRVKTPHGVLPLSQALELMSALFIEHGVDIERVATVLTYTVRGKEKYGTLEKAEQVVRNQWKDPLLASAILRLIDDGFEPLHDGFLYEIDIIMDDDKTLHWNKSWGEQSHYAIQRVKEKGVDIPWNMSIKSWYQRESEKSSPKKVSEWLDQCGFDGIAYEEPKIPGVLNYVVFNHENVNINAVIDDMNIKHQYPKKHFVKTLSNLDDELLVSQIHKELIHDIRMLYKNQGVRATKVNTLSQEDPLMELLKENFNQGKKGVDIFDGMMLYRGSKDINEKLSSFDDDYLHTTPRIRLARGYATHINNDIGFNPKVTNGIGKITEYTLPENVRFHQNFGIEESSQGLTKEEILPQLLPLVQAYAERGTDVSAYHLREYIHTYLYEVALPKSTEPKVSYLYTDYDGREYPLIPEFESIQTKITDLNHASLVNYGLNQLKNSVNNINIDRFKENLPEDYKQLQNIKDQINNVIQAYQCTPVPISSNLLEAEERRKNTTEMLTLTKIGQANGFIGFEEHSQLNILSQLKKDFDDVNVKAIENEKIICQNTVNHFISNLTTQKQNYDLSFNKINNQIIINQQTIKSNQEIIIKKTEHMRKIQKRIQDREIIIQKKSSGILGLIYRLTGQNKDISILEMDKKYFSKNQNDIKSLIQEIAQIDTVLYDSIQQKNNLMQKFQEKTLDLNTKWQEFSSQNRSMIGGILKEPLWQPSYLDDNFIQKWKSILKTNAHLDNEVHVSEGMSM